jgi:subtilisin family serine protease
MWAMGYSGQGMTIAVVDTGILTSHPAFAADPEIELVSFDVEDETDFGGDNEISAGELFPGRQIDW